MMESTKEQQRQYNDVDGLNQRLSDVSTSVNWMERLDVTISYRVAQDMLNVTKDITSEKTFSDGDASRIHDDFRREASFYKQAQEAAIEALHKLHSENVVTKRPDDYFAEMVKSDAHMQKIRRNLLEKQENIRAFEKAKKTQFAKKFGKKIEKEAILRKKMLRSEKSNNSQMKGASLLAMKTQKLEDKRVNNKIRSPNLSIKRRKKDLKYGNGGKKRTTKRNSSKSAADMSYFDSAIHSKSRKKHLNASNKRPGKSRRLQKHHRRD